MPRPHPRRRHFQLLEGDQVPSIAKHLPFFADCVVASADHTLKFVSHDSRSLASHIGTSSLAFSAMRVSKLHPSVTARAVH